MLAPVQPCSPLPQLGISRQSRAQSSRQTSWCQSVKHILASLPFVAAARRPATCASTETAACDGQQERRSRIDSSSQPSLTARQATCTSSQAARPRARSFPMHSSRAAGPSALVKGRLPGSTQRIGTAHSALGSVSASPGRTWSRCPLVRDARPQSRAASSQVAPAARTTPAHGRLGVNRSTAQPPQAASARASTQHVWSMFP